MMTFGPRQKNSREDPSHSLGPLHCHTLPHHQGLPHLGDSYRPLQRLCSIIVSSPFCPCLRLVSHDRS